MIQNRKMAETFTGWGYQDFPAGSILTTTVQITANQNGDSVYFYPPYIVSGTAIIVCKEDPSKAPYTGSTKILSSQVEVVRHMMDTIDLSGVPNMKWGDIRIYYYYKYMGIPNNYTIAPKTIVSSVFLDEMNQLFVSEEENSFNLQNINNALNLKADITSLHSHVNKAILDSLSDDGTGLKYKGIPLKGFVWELNVKDYGAKGDGATDDTAAINATITDAKSKGIATVIFPKGTYIITGSIDLQFATNINIVGDQATIKIGGTAETIMVLLKEAKSVYIQDLIWDGNASSITGVSDRKTRKPMFYCSTTCTDVHFVDNWFKNGFGSTMNLYGYSDGSIENNLFENMGAVSLSSNNNAGRSRIKNNIFRNSTGTGISMQGHNGTVQMVIIDGNTFDTLTRDDSQNFYAMGIEFNVNVQRVFVTNNRCKNLSDMGISISGVTNSQVALNYIETVGTLGKGYGTGIELVSCSSVVAANNISQYCTKACIVLDKCQRNIVIGNIFTQETKVDYTNENYCIFGGGTSTTTMCDYNIIEGNKLEGGTYGIYFPNYTSNLKVSNNLIYKAYAGAVTTTQSSNKVFDVINNTIVGCFVVMSNMDRAKIIGNTFDGIGVQTRGVRLYANNKNITIMNNNIYGVKYGIEIMENNAITNGVIMNNVMETTLGAYSNAVDGTTLINVVRKNNVNNWTLIDP